MTSHRVILLDEFGIYAGVMQMRSLILAAIAVALPVAAFAQQNNPLGQILGQAIGGGVAGTPLSLKPAGINSIGSLSVMFYVETYPKFGGGSEMACKTNAQIRNDTNSFINIRSLAITPINKYGQPQEGWIEMGEIGPGQSIIRTLTTNGAFDCGGITGIQMHPGGAQEWPNHCLVNNSPARPCPVTINATGRNINVQYR
ncbi:hypothetical protein [Paramagnetospirillum marisnigri]|uniref:hypothetical protein n=1 Tax=Paramagnetospirillum marisnigri TaxID=1285242 RepID=UPI000AB9573D|nr:hypothetical protein [Paramagnetospirillum marisnigri]